MRRTAVGVFVVVLTVACTASDSSSSSISDVSSTTMPIATSIAVPFAAPSSTTTSTLVAVASQPPGRVVVEQLESTGPLDSGLVWTQSPVGFDRNRSYWLGVVGDQFVLLSWDWPVADLAVQRSPDGFTWSAPTPLEGLPATASPVEMWRWNSGISGSSVGVIGLFDTTPRDDRQGGHQVFTSADGVEWHREILPGFDHASEVAGPFEVAASYDGYAVWVTADERLPQTDTLFVRSPDGAWQSVPLPEHGRTYENWVVATDEGFLVRVAELPEGFEGTHPVYHVTVDGVVSVAAMPSDQPPIRWNDSLVAYSPYNTVPQPTLYAGPDGDTWYRLPTPDFTTENEWQYWSIDALTAGLPGITVAGCPCGEYWSFLGEGFVTIEVDADDHHVTVHEDVVTVDGVWDHPLQIATASWFDPSTGTMTVPDPNTGEPIATVTCEQMRKSAQEKAYGSDLLVPPPQDLLYSPDGTTWAHYKTGDLFGVGAYIHHAATLNDTVTVMVDPTGEAPTPDPPGCQLGVYPETSPYEIWMTRP